MDWCDICAAMLLPGELKANPRFGAELCNHCAGEVAEANAMMDVEAAAA